MAQWLDHLLAVWKFPGSNLIRTSPVYPAVKGYPISDSARYCQINSLWASFRQPDCILLRKLRWFQIDIWSIGVIMSVTALWARLCEKSLYKCFPLLICPVTKINFILRFPCIHYGMKFEIFVRIWVKNYPWMDLNPWQVSRLVDNTRCTKNWEARPLHHSDQKLNFKSSYSFLHHLVVMVD